jgi:hypothetical protein
MARVAKKTVPTGALIKWQRQIFAYDKHMTRCLPFAICQNPPHSARNGKLICQMICIATKPEFAFEFVLRGKRQTEGKLLREVNFSNQPHFCPLSRLENVDVLGRMQSPKKSLVAAALHVGS